MEKNKENSKKKKSIINGFKLYRQNYKSFKEIFRDIIKYHFTKLIIVTLLLATLISFKSEILIFLDKYWISLIILKLNKHEVLECLILFIPLSVCYYRNWRLKKTPNYYNLLIIFSLSSIYFISDWNFHIKSYFFISIYLVVEILYLTHFLYHYGQTNEESSIFAIDTPLKSNEDNKEDSLGRDNLVETSAKNLRNSFFDEGAFYVAVTGEWGSGKTSFTNLLTEKMLNNEKDIIKIEINTWRTEDPNLFTKYFFNTLNKELSVYIPELSRLLPKYLAIVANSCDNKYLKGASKILDSFSNNNNDPYESIKKVLIKAKKKIIVVIDDIDRLNAEEIYQILKLVRNTVDFPYMQFIMNFDKEYVVDSINKLLNLKTHRRIIKKDYDKGNNVNSIINDVRNINNNKNQFIDKFISHEICLTSFESTNIANYLLHLLKKQKLDYKLKNIIFSKSNLRHGIYENSLVNKPLDKNEYFRLNNSIFISNILKNNRSVIKFYNSFIQTYNTIETNCNYNIEDLYYLELLKFDNYEVFLMLENNPLSILDINSNKTFYLRYNDLDILNNYTTKYILFNLFEYRMNSDIYKKDHSITNISCYDNYFYLRETNAFLTYTKFIDLINKDTYNDQIKILKKYNYDSNTRYIGIRFGEYMQRIGENKELYKKLETFLLKFIDDNFSKKNYRYMDNFIPNYKLYNFKNIFEFESHIKILKRINNNINKLESKNLKFIKNHFLYFLNSTIYFCINHINIYETEKINYLYELIFEYLKEKNIYKTCLSLENISEENLPIWEYLLHIISRSISVNYENIDNIIYTYVCIYKYSNKEKINTIPIRNKFIKYLKNINKYILEEFLRDSTNHIIKEEESISELIKELK